MNEEFYIKCAEALGTTYDCDGFKYPYRTRWNNRTAGHGRYPGYGFIRKFGDIIHVCLRSPTYHNKVYTSEEEVLAYLRDIVKGLTYA